jgi:hypothetical protein
MMVIFVDVKTFSATPLILIKNCFPVDSLTEIRRKLIIDKKEYLFINL